MSVQCAATFTMTLDLKEKPFITFRCEMEAHEGTDHQTTGTGSDGQAWEMKWSEKQIPMKQKGGENVNQIH